MARWMPQNIAWCGPTFTSKGIRNRRTGRSPEWTGLKRCHVKQLTDEQARTFLDVAAVIGEIIRELGNVPAGHLYARVMGQINLDQFNMVIGILVAANLVSQRNHELTWVGPAKEVR